jgi:hypothetical protein
MRGKIVVVFFFFVTAKSSCKLCGMKGHSKRFCSTVPKSGDDMVLESKKVESKKMESKKMESKKMESKKKLGEEENLVQVAKMEEEVEDEMMKMMKMVKKRTTNFCWTMRFWMMKREHASYRKLLTFTETVCRRLLRLLFTLKTIRRSLEINKIVSVIALCRDERTTRQAFLLHIDHTQLRDRHLDPHTVDIDNQIHNQPAMTNVAAALAIPNSCT